MKYGKITYILMLFFLMGCATPFSSLYQEDKDHSQSMEPSSIKDLFNNTTFVYRDQMDHYNNILTYDGPFYNADGHGFFDTMTVFHEDVLFNIFFLPGAAYAKGSLLVWERYLKIRGFEDSSPKPIPPDYLVCGLFYYTPALIFFPFYGAGIACTYIYDAAFHDIPVLITRGISYPFVKEEEAEEKKNLEPLELKYELADDGTSVTVLNVHYFPPPEEGKHLIEANCDLDSVFLDSIEYSKNEKILSYSLRFKDKPIAGIEITTHLCDKDGHLLHSIPHFETQDKDRDVTIALSLEKVPRLKDFKSAVILIKEFEKRPETESPPFIDNNIF